MSTTEDSFAARAITQGPKHHFFGYYGIYPWDATGKYHLCLQSDFHDRPPADGDSAVIGLIDMETGAFEAVAETQAWNLQQGSMMHWLPTAPDRLITYNARDDDRFISVIQDIHTGHKRLLPYPIAAITRDGHKALGLNYARLWDMRPVVGYPGLTDPNADKMHPDDDGLYIMDTATGEGKLLFSYEDARDYLSSYPEIQNHKLWFNHPFINRDDSRVAFVVVYWDDAGARRTVCLSMTLEGGDIRIMNDLLTSHCDWRTSDVILGWFTMKEGTSFFLVNDVTGEYESVRPDILSRDGHCSFTRDGAWLLDDEYPDDNDLRALFLWNMAEERLVVLGRFLSPPFFRNEIRCDLHPRWSRDERQVSFDSIHEGSRQIYVIDVSEVVER